MSNDTKKTPAVEPKKPVTAPAVTEKQLEEVPAADLDDAAGGMSIASHSIGIAIFDK